VRRPIPPRKCIAFEKRADRAEIAARVRELWPLSLSISEMSRRLRASYSLIVKIAEELSLPPRPGMRIRLRGAKMAVRKRRMSRAEAERRRIIERAYSLADKQIAALTQRMAAATPNKEGPTDELVDVLRARIARAIASGAGGEPAA
jgi:hypothetical protein